jgi:NADP-dependent aldehyde dehydrogenase
MILKGKMIIGYNNIDGNGMNITARNPSNGEILQPSYRSATIDLVESTCNLAWKAFKDFRHTTPNSRANFLQLIANNIEEIGFPLIDRAMQETGLTQVRLEGERARTCNQLRLFSSVILEGKYLDVRIDEALPSRKPLPRSDIRFQKIPLGPVAVFGASNFPLAFSVAGGDTASALAAGAPVIVKAHSAHPGTSELVAYAIQKAAKESGMPEGVFSLLYGSGNEIGTALVANKNIKAVGFTGSRSGGTALMKVAQERSEPIPVYAEMSSINPVYLLPQALVKRSEEIAESFVTAQQMGAGQFCTSPGLILAIDSESLDSFIRKSKDLIIGSSSQTMLTQGIYNAFENGVEALKGYNSITTIARGAFNKEKSQCAGVLFEAKASDFLLDSRLSEEVFGASTLILRCRDFDEMLAVTESLEGQLTGAVHMEKEDEDLASTLMNELELKVGRLLFNGFGTGVEVCDSMVHGGPYPATSDSRSTSVGTAAIDRFIRPVCYQDIPSKLIPESLKTKK